MDKELTELLERAKTQKIDERELEEHRVNLAVANGQMSDSRITVESMRATRLVVAAGTQRNASE